eukprot:6469895-Amphidinium_carterae.1
MAADRHLALCEIYQLLPRSIIDVVGIDVDWDSAGYIHTYREIGRALRQLQGEVAGRTLLRSLSIDNGGIRYRTPILARVRDTPQSRGRFTTRMLLTWTIHLAGVPRWTCQWASHPR